VLHCGGLNRFTGEVDGVKLQDVGAAIRALDELDAESSGPRHSAAAVEVTGVMPATSTHPDRGPGRIQ
jgi:hypothetical protein